MPRPLSPRPLGANETLESLTHWKTTFRTFYKRDDAYRSFIKDTAVWDPADANYGQATETEGLKRTAADMKEDLVDLLHTLAGYLPHAYLTDKIISNSKCWKDVYNIIYDHYGVQVTSESLLDFESLHKQTGETHRQFFERLLQHVKQHLAPAGVKVEQTTTTSADKMSISMMNMVALQWLRKTDPALIDIVRTEYSTELRSNTQLAELVPRITINIDSLLTRYNRGATSNKVVVVNEITEAVDNASCQQNLGKRRIQPNWWTITRRFISWSTICWPWTWRPTSGYTCSWVVLPRLLLSEPAAWNISTLQTCS